MFWKRKEKTDFEIRIRNLEEFRIQTNLRDIENEDKFVFDTSICDRGVFLIDEKMKEYYLIYDYGEKQSRKITEWKIYLKSADSIVFRRKRKGE